MNWLKILLFIASVFVAGTGAYFSVTGLGVLFSGATMSVIVMASSLEFAKIVTVSYLEQKWDTIGFLLKTYLTIAVFVLMLITSAGIFGYLSNAYQQQNLKLQQVDRELSIYKDKIAQNESQISIYNSQTSEYSKNQSTILTKGEVNNRLLKSLDNRDLRITDINDKVSALQLDNSKNVEYINAIKLKNVDIEREVGGFRFIAEAFNIELNVVVKWFIILIVLVFDPLAITMMIALNKLYHKEEPDLTIKTDDTPIELYTIYNDGVDDIIDEPVLDNTEVIEQIPIEVDIIDQPTNTTVKNKRKYVWKTPLKNTVRKSKTSKKTKKKPLKSTPAKRSKTNKSSKKATIQTGIDEFIKIDELPVVNTPYYLEPGFNWANRDLWQNDPTAVTHWIQNFKSSEYPTNFESKTY